jgi:hypothetical protein
VKLQAISLEGVDPQDQIDTETQVIKVDNTGITHD